MKPTLFHKGFTLIELLVVISIIAVLSSVALASMQSSRQKAIKTGTISQVRQYIIGIERYYSEYGEYPNPLGDTTTNYCLGTSSGTSCGANTASYVINTAFNTLLDPFIKTSIFKNSGVFSTVTYTGAWFKCTAITSGKCKSYVVDFVINGITQSECPVFHGVRGGSLNYCSVVVN